MHNLLTLTESTLTKVLDASVNGAHLNIMIEGLHGTGKTETVVQVAEKMGLTLLYFSAPTLDPFVDMVGVPRISEDGTLKFIRDARLEDADIIMIDEFNRADPKATDASLEMVESRTINGVPLPKLKCVIAAQNPPSLDYMVAELDPAMKDRFHVFMTSGDSADPTIVESTGIPREVANIICSWQSKLDKSGSYVSPRRCVKLAHNVIDFHTGTRASIKNIVESSIHGDLLNNVPTIDLVNDLHEELAKNA